MNPLTLVKRIQKINSTEASLGIGDEASWHAKYKESAYVFVGGIPYDLTEGDLLAVFAQYGEIVDVNLVRDKGTGKSKGFAFLAYEDQRSTILAVDNLNGANILGRIVRVDHVSNYKKKEEEDEEEEQKKREARGVCRAFQRGECNRGVACKFSHDERRSANTGWGPKDDRSRWDHDKYEGAKDSRKSAHAASDRDADSKVDGREGKTKSDAKDEGRSRTKFDDGDRRSYFQHNEQDLKDHDRRRNEKRSELQDKEQSQRQGRERHMNEKHLGRLDSEPISKEDSNRREIRKRSRYDEDKNEKHLGRLDSEPISKEDGNRQESRKRSRYDEDKSQQSPKGDKHGRGNEKWSGRYETEKSRKEEWGSQRSEKYSRYGRDDLKEDMDRRGSERHSRHDN